MSSTTDNSFDETVEAICLYLDCDGFYFSSTGFKTHNKRVYLIFIEQCNTTCCLRVDWLWCGVGQGGTPPVWCFGIKRKI